MASAASLKKSNIQLGSDKKYYNYREAKSTFQDGFRLPIPFRGHSQLASIKERDLERNESGQTLEGPEAGRGRVDLG